jgi:quercetin dioxygenase-like cupin family protein
LPFLTTLSLEQAQTEGVGMRRSRVAGVAGAVVLALGVAVTDTAAATPESGVSGVVHATGTSADGVRLNRKGPTDVTFRMVTIAPGGSTGWHYHDGELLAVVRSGTLTRYFADCATETTVAGTSFVEPAGRRHVHLGRNLGPEPVVLWVAYVVPQGSPLAVDAPDPGCGVR